MRRSKPKRAQTHRTIIGSIGEVVSSVSSGAATKPLTPLFAANNAISPVARFVRPGRNKGKHRAAGHTPFLKSFPPPGLFTYLRKTACAFKIMTIEIF